MRGTPTRERGGHKLRQMEKCRETKSSHFSDKIWLLNEIRNWEEPPSCSVTFNPTRELLSLTTVSSWTTKAAPRCSCAQTYISSNQTRRGDSCHQGDGLELTLMTLLLQTLIILRCRSTAATRVHKLSKARECVHRERTHCHEQPREDTWNELGEKPTHWRKQMTGLKYAGRGGGRRRGRKGERRKIDRRRQERE